MRPQTICTKCDGTGKAEISETLYSTLKRIGKRRVTADDVLEEGVERNAITARLDALCDIGLLGKTREQRGSPWIYFRTTQDSQPASRR